MIQKGDKVMHLTGDSVIRQNGYGFVIDFSVKGVNVLWETNAFVSRIEPNTNHCHIVSESCLGTVATADLMTTGNGIEEPKYWIPTPRLRWIERSTLTGIAVGIGDTNKPETVYTNMKFLQQYWEDNQGNGEWRDVPTEHEGK